MVESPDKSREKSKLKPSEKVVTEIVAPEKPEVIKLVGLINIANSIPSFKDIEASDFDTDVLLDAKAKLSDLHKYVKDDSKELTLAERRIKHDLGNAFVPVFAAVDLIQMGQSESRKKFLSKIDNVKNRIVRVIRTNLTLLKDKPNLEESSLLETAKNGVQDALNSRKDYTIDETGTQNENGVISLDIPKNLMG